VHGIIIIDLYKQYSLK